MCICTLKFSYPHLPYDYHVCTPPLSNLYGIALILGLGSSFETLEFLVKRGACDSGLQVALLKSRLCPLQPPPPPDACFRRGVYAPSPSHLPTPSHLPVEESTRPVPVEEPTRPVLSIYSDCLCPYLHLAVLQCSNLPHTTTPSDGDEGGAGAGVGRLSQTSLAGRPSHTHTRTLLHPHILSHTLILSHTHSPFHPP